MLADLHVQTDDVDFACLSRGSGPLALCLHGFPDTPVSLIPLLEALADAGYRAVAPWLRGYAPTSIPADGDYGVPRLAADAAALHAALGGGPDAVLIGHDWGAAAAYAGAVANPDRWSKVVVMSVPPPPHFMQLLLGYDQLKRSFYMWLFQLGIAELVVSSHDLAFIDGLWADWSPSYQPGDDLAEVKRSLRAPANLTAALGYYRAAFAGFALGAAPPTAAPVPPQPCKQPGLYLHGAEDGCIAVPEPLLAKIETSFGPGSAAELVDGAGHFMINERPEQVSTRIVEFLRG